MVSLAAVIILIILAGLSYACFYYLIFDSCEVKKYPYYHQDNRVESEATGHISSLAQKPASTIKPKEWQAASK